MASAWEKEEQRGLSAMYRRGLFFIEEVERTEEAEWERRNVGRVVREVIGARVLLVMVRVQEERKERWNGRAYLALGGSIVSL